MKKIKNFIILAIAAAVFVLLCGKTTDARAMYYDFNFTSSAVVNGQTGDYITEQVCTFDFGSSKLVRAIPYGENISRWFDGATSPRPAGLQAFVYEEAEVGSSELKVLFKGLVYGASKDTMTMKVPVAYFDSTVNDFNSWSEVKLTGGAKYNITRNFTVPSGYMGVGYGIYFDKSQNNGNGFKLTGTKGQELTGKKELKVVIDGYFIQGIDKNKDITSWFTGHVIAQNNFYNTSLNSQLPPGVYARIKNTVNVGDNSFTIEFYGTPTKGSKDLIAITIPAGYVTYNPGVVSDYKGDLQNALKTYNVSGHFVYNIESPDNDYKSVYILATYPDTTIHAGSTYTEADGLIAKYQLVGTDSTGQPYKFKDIRIGSELKGYIVQNTSSGEYLEPISRSTGLSVKVSKISEDGTYMEATITGKAKKISGLLQPVGTGSGTQLLHTASTYGKYIDFIASEDTHFWFGQPDPQITTSKDIIIESTHLDTSPVFSDTVFTINLGNDTLAKSFSAGDKLSLFAYKYSDEVTSSLDGPEKKWTTKESWNGLYLKVKKAAAQGSNSIEVELSSGSNGILVDYYGYLKLALPRSYLTNATAYGADNMYEQAGYPIANTRIFLNVEKNENYYAASTDVSLSGNMRKARLLYDVVVEDPDEPDGYRVVAEGSIKEYFHAGIGSGRVYFTVTTLKDIKVSDDYPAGASVKNLIRLVSLPLETSPFQDRTWPYKDQYWENYYDIHTVNAISKDNDGEKSAHTFEFYIELKEIRAVQSSHEKLSFEICDGTTWRKVYTSAKSKYDIEGDWLITYDVEEYEAYKKKCLGSGTSDGSNGSGENFNSGIIYNNDKDIILYATDKDGQKVETSYINLSEEKLVTDFAYTHYSLDGGEKWKETKTNITDKQLTGFLNKGMTLMLTDSYDKKAKKLGDNAKVLSFPKINARPAAVKYKVDYVTYADTTGATAGQWMLADKNLNPVSAEDLSKLEIGVAGEDKKLSEDGYGSWPSSGGLSVAPLKENKTVTVTYFVRMKPTDDTPASKAVKVTVKGQQTAPKTKVDYKKEQIKLKKGEVLYFGESISGSVSELTENAATYEDYAGKMVVAGDSAKVVDISPYITDARNTVMIWSAASSKKAASAVKTIKLAARAPIAAETVTVSKGKMNLDKKYEVYYPGKNKWGGAPKPSESGEYRIRLKATVKSGQENDETFAAGLEGTLKVTYGEWDTSKHKSGVTAASIVVGTAVSDSGSGTDSGSGEDFGSGTT